jgi:hypothetical protein
MSEETSDHLDEHGRPCTRHVVAAPDLVALAAIGSRTSSFNHDAASKLQSLMMALDEISELVDLGDPSLRVATETAHTALRELHQLFTANRALTKPPQRSPIRLAELVSRAADRFGVAFRGELPELEVEAGPPAMTHALALVLDLCAGAGAHGRTVELAVTIEPARVGLAITGVAGAIARSPQERAVVLSLASFLIARDHGELRCGDRDERCLVWLARAPGA